MAWVVKVSFSKENKWYCNRPPPSLSTFPTFPRVGIGFWRNIYCSVDRPKNNKDDGTVRIIKKIILLTALDETSGFDRNSFETLLRLYTFYFKKRVSRFTLKTSKEIFYTKNVSLMFEGHTSNYNLDSPSMYIIGI